MALKYLLIVTIICCPISFIANAEPLFYAEDFDFRQQQNRLGAELFCKGCETILDILENKLPLKMLGKGPRMALVRILCTATSFANPLWIIGCPIIAEQIVDFILDGGTPKEACKSAGICPC